MPHFFAKPTNLLVRHEQTLDKSLANKVKFNPRDPLHTELITSCSQAVKDRLANLQTTDIKITCGFAIGVAALLLSYFLPFTVVAIAGFAFGAYYLSQRQAEYAEHTHALENLSKCCAWVLGEVSLEDVRNNALSESAEVKEMLATLAPLASTEQLREFMDAKISNELIKEIEKIKENITLFDKHLDKEKVDLYFKIYGYQQGGFLAILSGIGYAILNGFSMLGSSIVSCFKSNPPSTDEAEQVSSPTI